jgi:hypothetical protein
LSAVHVRSFPWRDPTYARTLATMARHTTRASISHSLGPSVGLPSSFNSPGGGSYCLCLSMLCHSDQASRAHHTRQHTRQNPNPLHGSAPPTVTRCRAVLAFRSNGQTLDANCRFLPLQVWRRVPSHSWGGPGRGYIGGLGGLAHQPPLQSNQWAPELGAADPGLNWMVKNSV